MSDETRDKKQADKSEPTGGEINDPLTRRDVDAPRAPFDAKPEERKDD